MKRSEIMASTLSARSRRHRRGGLSVAGAAFDGHHAAIRLLAPGLGVLGGDPRAISALATPTGPMLASASRGMTVMEDREMSFDD